MPSLSHQLYARLLTVSLVMAAAVFGGSAFAQAPIGSGTYAMKLYHVNYGFYPIVEAYIRTWDDQREPLVNLNIANIGLQVKGRNYNPETAVVGRQYTIETLERRSEGFRTVIVLDASGTMRGKPFADALNAINRFVEAKRPVDQVAVLAIRDSSTGYEVVSGFESNPSLLYQRVSDVKPDGQQTRLYDTVAAALQMCATAFSGDMTSLDYAVLSTIIVLSDGKDEGSAITRSDLINRIGQLQIPIPIHSIAFTQIGKQHLLNIEALSTATFGRYWDLDDTERLAQTMQHIHRINRSDYVVTFRSYIDVDGGSHPFRVGVEYPSGSGSFLWGTGNFEAIDSPAVFNASLRERYQQLNDRYPVNPAAAFGAAPGELPQAPAGAVPPAGVAPGSFEPVTTEPGSASFDVAAVSEDAVGEPGAAEVEESAAAPATEAAEEEDVAAASGGIPPAIQNNALLIVAGGMLVLLLVVMMMWVKRGSRVDAAPTGTSPMRDTDTGRRSTNSGTPMRREAATRASGNDWNN